MNKIIGLILIIIGGVLIYEGVQRKDSLAGAASKIGTDVANAVDGAGRIPKHYYYIIGGGVLAAAGLGVAVSGRKS
ncbi:MAG TPA: DUF3185 family protein [Rariglobus sp.]